MSKTATVKDAEIEQTHLRIGLFPSFFYEKTLEGTLKGYGIDLAEALAERLSAKLSIQEYAAPPAVVMALKAGDCDVAVLGIDAKRALDIDYTPPLLSADFTFLLPPAERAAKLADLDRHGLRVAIVRHHTMDDALGDQLKHAERAYGATPIESFELLRSGRADVVAGIRPGLVSFANLLPGLRVLPDRYGENVFALAVDKGGQQWLLRVRRFVSERLVSGEFQRMIERAGLSGVASVPL